MPALTFVATAHAALYCGAQPVLADVESPSRPLLDPKDVERKLSERTRAIVPVHYAGGLCDMSALERFARWRLGLARADDSQWPACRLVTNEGPRAAPPEVSCFGLNWSDPLHAAR